ncbi:MAG: hypothetical protein CM15mP74_06530 [Halieaceae bacterium]|nr:MAG: hypothetical protein CM15mP74_06530 [Halieaceae bacterium]
MIIILGEAQAPKVIEHFGRDLLECHGAPRPSRSRRDKNHSRCLFFENVTCSRDQLGELLSCRHRQDPGVIDKGCAALERAHQPAAVSSRRAVPDTLCLDQDNVSVWLDQLQKISGPEPGIPTANDCVLRGGIGFKRWVSVSSTRPSHHNEGLATGQSQSANSW